MHAMLNPRTVRKATRISVEGLTMAVLFFLLFESFYPVPAPSGGGAFAVGTDSRMGPHDGTAAGTVAHLHRLLAQAGHRALASPLARLAKASSSVPSLPSVFDSESDSICPTCNASVPGGFAALRVPLLERDEARAVFLQPGQASGKALLRRFLVQHIPFAATVSKAWMWDKSQNAMFNSFLAAPDALLSYNFSGLSLDKPTAYIYSRTGGKKLDNERRLAYFQMHHDTIHAFQDKVAKEGFADSAKAEDRQLLYIIVRDDSEIDPEIDAFFRESSIPYLYFSVGPTKDHGIAQWNAVERAVEVVRDNFFGDGPVLNVDDDARISPELLDRIWRVDKLIAWPVGNMYPEGWEGLMCEGGKQHHWRLGWIPERVFPIDMQGFAINSSEIGTGRSISGPRYVDFSGRGGESAFLEQISQKRDEAECLCDDTQAEGCFFAWHNWRDADVASNSGPLSVQKYRQFYEKQKKKLELAAAEKEKEPALAA